MSVLYYPPADDLAGMTAGQLQMAYDDFVTAHDLASRPAGELLLNEIAANGATTAMAAWLKAHVAAWGSLA